MHDESLHDVEDETFTSGACDTVFDEDVREVYDFTGPVLGSGAFATVLRVKDKTSGMEYAIKQVRPCSSHAVPLYC